MSRFPNGAIAPNAELNRTTQDWYSTARVSKRLTDGEAACLRARYCTVVPMLRGPI